MASKKNTNKAHGSTPASLFGKTLEALRVDDIIKVMHNPESSKKFTDPGTDLQVMKILVKVDGQTEQVWFNTYQKEGTQPYVGEKCNLDKNHSAISEADFDARCAENGYVAFDGDLPPQIATIEEMAAA